MPRTATFAAIQRYVLSCGLLLVPASIWNIALTERLPSPFAPAEFWRDIPAPLAWAENSLRVAVFVLPFVMPLKRRFRSHQARGCDPRPERGG